MKRIVLPGLEHSYNRSNPLKSKRSVISKMELLDDSLKIPCNRMVNLLDLELLWSRPRQRTATHEKQSSSTHDGPQPKKHCKNDNTAAATAENSEKCHF